MATFTVPHVNEAIVLSKCNFYVDTHLWPLKSKLDPEGWLNNFTADEREFAIHLLNGFMYFSNDLVDQLFIAAFRGLSRTVVDQVTPPNERLPQWREFVDSVIITYPTGETASAADSGHLFVRRARDLIGIPEARIMAPDRALQALISRTATRILFVDDFVGSGQQFYMTWHRRVPAAGGESFDSQNVAGTALYYMPLFCTQFAITNALAALSTKVQLCAAHTLTSEYSALNDPSIFWPDSLKRTAVEFIRNKSREIGLPDAGGNVGNDWQGFCKLGLGISFEHHIPDASLPLFYTTMNGWKPLWRRSP